MEEKDRMKYEIAEELGLGTDVKSLQAPGTMRLRQWEPEQ